MPTRVSAGVVDHLCFLTFYNYDPYWQIFPNTCINDNGRSREVSETPFEI